MTTTKDTQPLPCPFCGEPPKTVERPDNIDGTQFFYAVACYCDGYSACAHKMAVRDTPEQAKADAISAWNRRASPTVAVPSDLDRQLDQVLTERDAASDYIDALLDEVLGTGRHEWTSNYGHADAMAEVRETMEALRDKAAPTVAAPTLTSVCHMECDTCLDAGKCQFTAKAPQPVAGELPPLPEPWIRDMSAGQPESRDHFAADQMLSYGIQCAVEAELRGLSAAQAQPKPLTGRERELLDGLIERELRHAEQCDGIANRRMADKQKGWDMERVALLRKLGGIGDAAIGQEGKL